MKTLKILSVDNKNRSMVIDWGDVTYNQHIPSIILENPDLTKGEILTILESERPVESEPIDIPKNLLDLVVESEEGGAVAQKRLERDWKIQEVRWRIERYNDEIALGQEPTEPLEPILAYIQLLRDLPDQPGFPDVDFPEEPPLPEAK